MHQQQEGSQVVKLNASINWLITFHLIMQSAHGTLFSRHDTVVPHGSKLVSNVLKTDLYLNYGCFESESCKTAVPDR